jgi:hypothetical protein
MKIKIILSVYLFVVMIFFTLAACSVVSTDAELHSLDKATEQQDETKPEKAVVAQEFASPDSDADSVDLTGSWADINDMSRFINITKSGEEYVYEDNEGKLQTAYKDGVLEVKVSDTDIAKVYLDKSTGHLLMVYQDNLSEFEKK